MSFVRCRWNRVFVPRVSILLLACGVLAADASAQTLRSGAGLTPPMIQAVVDQFRTDLGGGAVAGPHGAFGGARREINWDGIPDALASPTELSGDFFNATSPRGIVFTPDETLGPAAAFRVSQDDDAPSDPDLDQWVFSDLKPEYANQFRMFSPERLFTVLSARKIDVRFYLPGTDTPAVVRGFGAVFTGVDLPLGASIAWFDANDQLLAYHNAPVGALSFLGLSYPDARIARVVITPGTTPLGDVDEFPNVIDVVAMDDFIYGEPELRKYILAEGATSSFFDTEIALANPRASETPVTLSFIKPDGAAIVQERVVPGRSRVTLALKDIEGLEATEVSTIVVPKDGQALGVERTMLWDGGRYGGHTGEAVDAGATRWLFAEGVQGFFDTFFLLVNGQAAPTTATFTFLLEEGAPIVKVRDLPARSRLTVSAAEFPELVGRAFGVIVESPLPIVAERAVYFGSLPGQLWTGGHESPGVTEARSAWHFSEGAMGEFFDTFLLLMNPGDADATATLTYRRPEGDPITVQKVVKSRQRLTIKLEDEDPALAYGTAAVSISSTAPIVAERSMYWIGSDAQPWTEGHNSFGTRSPWRRWLLAEGRVGGPLQQRTFILLAHPYAANTTVTLTFLRANGAPLVKQVVLAANSRRTFDVATEAPELQDESFGVLIESSNSGTGITVERSMYWDAKGVFWGGGTNATASPLSLPTLQP